MKQFERKLLFLQLEYLRKEVKKLPESKEKSMIKKGILNILYTVIMANSKDSHSKRIFKKQYNKLFLEGCLEK